MYNILYLGTKPIGERCFSKLAERKWKNLHIEAICSHCSYDNYWYQGNSIYLYAQKHDIPFVDNEKRHNNTLKDFIERYNINLILSVGHKWILPDEILRMVDYNAWNLHLAKLPDYKGNFAYNHAILNGENEYGVTLHRLSPVVDEGDIFQMSTFPVTEGDTAYSLYVKSLSLGITMFEELLWLLEKEMPIKLTPQKGEGHFYDRHSLDGFREISNLTNLDEVDRKSRAFYFPTFERAYIMNGNKKYYIEPANGANYEGGFTK